METTKPITFVPFVERKALRSDRTHAIISNQTAIELVLASEQTNQSDRNELTALAGRIQLCNHESNAWFIPDHYVNDDNRTSDAVGRFWRCNSKLCSSCLARQSRQNRKQLRAAVAAQPKKLGYRQRFITLTIPNPDLSLTETRSIVNYAWSLFRKRSLCVALILGGAKSEEFTLTKVGFHYHLHLLIYSKWISQKELRKTWSECVRSSYAQHERDYAVITKHGELIVDIRDVTNTERSIAETCKYITKTAGFAQLKRTDLIAIAKIQRWHRMFELFGSFRIKEKKETTSTKPSLDTKTLFDGGSQPSRKYWRQRVQSASVEVYLIELEQHIDRQREWQINQMRKAWPLANIYTLDCI